VNRVTRDRSGSAEEPGAAGMEMCAEDMHVFERLIIAPVSGTFHPSFPDVCPEQPAMVAIGDQIGVVVRSGEKHTVESAFTGLLLGLLVLPGERVRQHQPIGWLSTDDHVWG
jgi:biotin carboxyl carrier protein